MSNKINEAKKLAYALNKELRQNISKTSNKRAKELATVRVSGVFPPSSRWFFGKHYHATVNNDPPEVRSIEVANNWIKTLFWWLKEDEAYIRTLTTRIEELESRVNSLGR